jgi:hypothetical protein
MRRPTVWPSLAPLALTRTLGFVAYQLFHARNPQTYQLYGSRVVRRRPLNRFLTTGTSLVEDQVMRSRRVTLHSLLASDPGKA